MLVALSTLAAEQSQATAKTATGLLKFLNHCATKSDAKLHYTHSDMILCIHSDTSYLSEPKVHSHAGGHYFLGNNHDTTYNGTILNLI